MRIYKNKAFSKWAVKEKLNDGQLKAAVDEMERGLIDADLGGYIFKKRIAQSGRGKSGSTRTIIAYKVEGKAFFVYGFAKNERANINKEELKALKLYASELLGYNEQKLTKAVKAGILIEVESNE